MGLSNREYVGRALDTLATSLGSYIASVLEGVAPGISWPKLLEHKDASAEYGVDTKQFELHGDVVHLVA